MGKTQSPIGKNRCLFILEKPHRRPVVWGKNLCLFILGKTHLWEKTFCCLHRCSRYLVLVAVVGKTQCFVYWEKTLLLIGVSSPSGCCLSGISVSISCFIALSWFCRYRLFTAYRCCSHYRCHNFCCLQPLLLYITKYLLQYYLLRYSTYVLYITAALSLVLL